MGKGLGWIDAHLLASTQSTARRSGPLDGPLEAVRGRRVPRDVSSIQSMDISGSYTFDAPPDRVWALLMDPAVISSCIPGCDRFEPTGENTLSRHARPWRWRRSPVRTKARSRCRTWSPPSSYRLIAEGQGRPGFVKGSSAITLRADGATTIVDVAGTVQTGGPIARLGQRLIGGVSKMMLDRFFACLQAKLTTSAG